jgi:nuclear pore complex protein Nup93
LQPLQDTDVAGFLRHAHEQNLISTIEEGRRETQDDFYRMLEDRAHRDWEAKKRRVFEELGVRVTADSRALVELKQSTHSRSALTASVSPSITLQMQSKMMAYDRVVSDLNSARLRGTSFPIVHALVEASLAVAPDVRFFLPIHIQLTKSLSQDQCK